jgi:hypothetical protein
VARCCRFRTDWMLLGLGSSRRDCFRRLRFLVEHSQCLDHHRGGRLRCETDLKIYSQLPGRSRTQYFVVRKVRRIELSGQGYSSVANSWEEEGNRYDRSTSIPREMDYGDWNHPQALRSLFSFFLDSSLPFSRHDLSNPNPHPWDLEDNRLNP